MIGMKITIDSEISPTGRKYLLEKPIYGIITKIKYYDRSVDSYGEYYPPGTRFTILTEEGHKIKAWTEESMRSGYSLNIKDLI
jgi:hypothetical protein